VDENLKKQLELLEKKPLVDAAGIANFKDLRVTAPVLAEAIASFEFKADRDAFCGHCAEALYYHLKEAGFTGFHQHSHGHSFLANDDIVIDVWPDGVPKVWGKRDEILVDSVYASRVDNSCWCGDPEYGPHEHIGTPLTPAPKGPGL
jgi:hypothetical protein